jgi:hypothetical protein
VEGALQSATAKVGFGDPGVSRLGEGERRQELPGERCELHGSIVALDTPRG